MARAQANKLYRNFVKGLITEASELTYPENASIREDNCIITRKGNRRRRKGVDYLNNFVLSGFTEDQNEAENIAFKTYEWTSVADDADRTFLVFQHGGTLSFFNISNPAQPPEEKSFTVDLDTFKISTAPESIIDQEVSITSGKGILFVSGKFINPFSVEYDEDTDLITAKAIFVLIRDFKGVDDGLANHEEPTSLSNDHEYNLRNQGWISPSQDNTGNTIDTYSRFGNQLSVKEKEGPIGDYFSAKGRYPGNNKQWWVAKDSNGDFDATLFDKFYFGNTAAPKGHYIVNAFNIDRSSVSGVSGLDVERTNIRPQGLSFFAGRVWYGLNSDVFFSQVLDDVRQAGFCYQEADPTAEDLNQLVATDGGRIPIPEALDIVRLVPSGNGVLVFARNGVWFVSGTDSGFTARDFAVSKVSDIGIIAPNSIVEADGTIFWWSKTGIQGYSQQVGVFGPVPGGFDKNNISETTIQSFYNDDIPQKARENVKGHFDPSSNVVQWLFRNDELEGKNLYNRVLNLDLTLSAFYPWTISSSDSGPYIVSLYRTAQINDDDRNRLTRYVVAAPDGDNFKFTFASFNNGTFVDWQKFEDSTEYTYSSFVETGYELLEDASRDKEITHLVSFFEKTETEWADEDEDGDLSVLNRSSCKLQVRWDWADSPSSGNWTREIEAYRPSRIVPPNAAGDTFDTGSKVVRTRNKIRGHGTAIQFRFSSEEANRDFNLLGWSVLFTGNTLP